MATKASSARVWMLKYCVASLKLLSKHATATIVVRAGTCGSVLVEDKSSGTGLIQELQGALPLPITPVPRDTDKLTRALDVQGHHAAGKVVLPAGDEDNFEFVSEVAGFTADDSHRFDDQTDVMMDALYHVYVSPHVGSKGKAGVW
jgi:predicted phage terminase large subunit-like protein